MQPHIQKVDQMTQSVLAIRSTGKQDTNQLARLVSSSSSKCRPSKRLFSVSPGLSVPGIFQLANHLSHTTTYVERFVLGLGVET
jgi:hypothetical protein